VLMGCGSAGEQLKNSSSGSVFLLRQWCAVGIEPGCYVFGAAFIFGAGSLLHLAVRQALHPFFQRSLLFPSLSWVLAQFLFQGVLYNTISVLVVGSQQWSAVVLGLLAVLGCLLFAAFSHQLRPASLAYRPFLRCSCFGQVAKHHPTSSLERLLAHYRGQWLPKQAADDWGSIVASYVPQRWFFPFLLLMRCAINVLLAAVPLRGRADCLFRYAAVAAMQVGFGIMSFLLAPSRLRLNDYAISLSSTLIGLVCLLSLVVTALDSNIGGSFSTLTTIISFLQIVVVLVASAISALCGRHEDWWGEVEVASAELEELIVQTDPQREDTTDI
jgi:hypothetical protein